MVMIGILPTLDDEHLSRANAEPQPALPAAQRPDPRRPRRGHRHRHRGSRAAAARPDSIVPEAACTSTQLHIQVSPDNFAAYWNASQAISRHPARARRQLAVPPGQAAVARDPDPAVRAGHRHPRRGAQGAGRPPPGVVRRALDQLDLRPVRGERPLLPGAAADHRRRGPAARCSRPAAPQRCRELRLHNGTIYRWNRPVYDVVDGRPAPPRGEPRARRRADRRRHDGQRRLLLRAGARARREDRPLWSQMSFCAAEENFHVAAEHGIEAQRLLAGHRAGPGDRARRYDGCCRWPRRARTLGRRGRRGSAAARHHRAALRDRPQRRVVVRRPGHGAREKGTTGLRRCA